MKVMELARFGIENLKIVDAEVPVPGPAHGTGTSYVPW